LIDKNVSLLSGCLVLKLSFDVTRYRPTHKHNEVFVVL